MNLNPIKTNMTELAVNGVGTILFSYRTPVAAKTPEGSFKTEKKWSNTTSRHITQWGGKEWPTQPQEWFDNLIAGVK